eukprot:SAG31_NODE_35380_length_323_cov_1.379464_1_plen_76_part_01
MGKLLILLRLSPGGNLVQHDRWDKNGVAWSQFRLPQPPNDLRPPAAPGRLYNKATTPLSLAVAYTLRSYCGLDTRW